MTTAVKAALGTHDRVGGAWNPRSDVGNLQRGIVTAPSARHGGWRFPHRSRRELAIAALWWVVVAVGVTVGVVYIVGER